MMRRKLPDGTVAEICRFWWSKHGYLSTQDFNKFGQIAIARYGSTDCGHMQDDPFEEIRVTPRVKYVR